MGIERVISTNVNFLRNTDEWENMTSQNHAVVESQSSLVKKKVYTPFIINFNIWVDFESS